MNKFSHFSTKNLQDTMNRIKVIFITGSSRSGTTLLDRILGQVPGFFSLGEVFYIWERGILQNQLCGCGKPFRDCEFWSQVIDEFSAYHSTDFLDILQLQREVTRIRNIPYFIFPSLRPKSFQLKLHKYTVMLATLYRTIANVSNASILIDSSKFAPHGFVLKQIPYLDLFVIHIMRDSRGVVYSLQRKKVRPEIYWRTEYMPRAETWLKGTRVWLIDNFLAHILRITTKNSRLLRYEKFVQNPRSVIEDLINWIGLPNPSILNPFHRERLIKLRVNHTVSGNPVRFVTGPVEIKEDVEWITKMSWFKKVMIGVLTKPLGNHITWSK